MHRSRISARPTKSGHRVPGEADNPLAPSISALRDVEAALRQEHIDRAWVDLDLAALRLARQEQAGQADSRLLGRAAAAVERARDLLGRAQVSQAAAAISGAVLMLLG